VLTLTHYQSIAYVDVDTWRDASKQPPARTGELVDDDRNHSGSRDDPDPPREARLEGLDVRRPLHDRVRPGVPDATRLRALPELLPGEAHRGHLLRRVRQLCARAHRPAVLGGLRPRAAVPRRAGADHARPR